MFLYITCPGMIYYIQKDSRGLDDQNPSRKMMEFSSIKEALDPFRKATPLRNSGISDELFFLGKTR